MGKSPVVRWVGVGGSKKAPWMNGSHGEKTPSLTTEDMKRGFKGAREVIKHGKELRDRQKVYRIKLMTQEALTCLQAGTRLSGGEFLSGRT